MGTDAVGEYNWYGRNRLSRICSDLVGSGETVLEVLQRLVWLGYVTMYLEHQNFAISAEGCSGSEFIVSRAKKLRCTHFCLNRHSG